MCAAATPLVSTLASAPLLSFSPKPLGSRPKPIPLVASASTARSQSQHEPVCPSRPTSMEWWYAVTRHRALTDSHSSNFIRCMCCREMIPVMTWWDHAMSEAHVASAHQWTGPPICLLTLADPATEALLTAFPAIASYLRCVSLATQRSVFRAAIFEYRAALLLLWSEGIIYTTAPCQSWPSELWLVASWLPFPPPRLAMVIARGRAPCWPREVSTAPQC